MKLRFHLTVIALLKWLVNIAEPKISLIHHHSEKKALVISEILISGLFFSLETRMPESFSMLVNRTGLEERVKMAVFVVSAILFE